MTLDGHSSPEETTDADDSREERERFTFVDHVDGILNSSPRRNLAQALTVLLFMGVGAEIGFFVVNDRPDLAALVGAILGMIAGTFLSGFVIMLLPPHRIQLTRSQIQRKYIACRKRFWIAGTVAVLMLVALPFVIGKFARESTDLAWLLCMGWPLATVAACVYAKGLAQRLRELRCPQCSVPLRIFWKTCPQCGFPLIPTSDTDWQSD